MTNRPTPEQATVDFLERASENPLGTPLYIEQATPQELALSLLDKYAELGYRVVHPDDEDAVFQLAVDAGIIVKRRTS